MLGHSKLTCAVAAAAAAAGCRRAAAADLREEAENLNMVKQRNKCQSGSSRAQVSSSHRPTDPLWAKRLTLHREKDFLFCHHGSTWLVYGTSGVLQVLVMLTVVERHSSCSTLHYILSALLSARSASASSSETAAEWDLLTAAPPSHDLEILRCFISSL